MKLSFNKIVLKDVQGQTIRKGRTQSLGSKVKEVVCNFFNYDCQVAKFQAMTFIVQKLGYSKYLEWFFVLFDKYIKGGCL